MSLLRIRRRWQEGRPTPPRTSLCVLAGSATNVTARLGQLSCLPCSLRAEVSPPSVVIAANRGGSPAGTPQWGTNPPGAAPCQPMCHPGDAGRGEGRRTGLVLAPVTGSSQPRRARAAHHRVHDELAGLGQVFGQQRPLHVTAQGVLDGNGEERAFSVTGFHLRIFKETSQCFRET